MLLRAAIVFLSILNLGVAAWVLGGGAPPLAVAPSDPGPPGLRLLDEPPDAVARIGESSASQARAPQSVAAGSARPVTPSSPAPPPPPTATAERCVAFGPFADVAAREAARIRLQALTVALVPRESAPRPARGWRVYLPPLASRAAAQAVVDGIKAAGIDDWYIIANGSEANSIALGRYGSEDSARRRQAQLAAKGFQARAEPLGDTPPQWWLDARFAPDASRASLAAIAPSTPLDCARLP